MLLALIAAVVGVLVATGGWDALRPSSVADWPGAVRALADRAAAWGPGVFIGAYCVASFAFVPRGFLALGAGMAWGWPSAGYTYVGALIGESLAFAAARGLGRRFVQRMLGDRWQRWDAALARAGFQTVLVLRLVPLVPCDVINYGAGLGAVRYRDFIGATALGIIPGCILYALAGAGLVSGNPVVLVFGIGGLALLAVVPFAWKRWRQSPVEPATATADPVA